MKYIFKASDICARTVHNSLQITLFLPWFCSASLEHVDLGQTVNKNKTEIFIKVLFFYATCLQCVFPNTNDSKS